MLQHCIAASQHYSVELHYLYKPTSIVSDTTGTWLSSNARNALLYGSLVEAYTFLKGEPDLMAQYENRFQQEILRLKNKAEGALVTVSSPLLRPHSSLELLLRPLGL